MRSSQHHGWIVRLQPVHADLCRVSTEPVAPVRCLYEIRPNGESLRHRQVVQGRCSFLFFVHVPNGDVDRPFKRSPLVENSLPHIRLILRPHRKHEDGRSSVRTQTATTRLRSTLQVIEECSFHERRPPIPAHGRPRRLCCLWQGNTNFKEAHRLSPFRRTRCLHRPLCPSPLLLHGDHSSGASRQVIARGSSTSRLSAAIAASYASHPQYQ